MYTKSTLKNGITLITVPVKGTRATTVLAMFPVGSRYETEKLSGASHFVEHMLFKGTKKRPTAQHISRAADAAGAEYNAFTYKDYTGYYFKIDSKKQELAFDLLSDMIFNSVIDSAEVEKEKGAIVEELRMYMDNPLMAIDILSDRQVFGNNQLGWDIGGSEKTVRGMTREELWAYFQQHYSAKNMVLVVSGNVERRLMKKLLGYFDRQISPAKATTPAFYKKNYDKFSWPTTSVALAERVVVEKRAVDQAQILFTFPGLSVNDTNRFALAILLNILGSGMSSRLFVEVREKRGLAYMVRSSASSFRDTGATYVQAGLDPKRMKEAVGVIKTELEKIAQHPVTVQELADAKSNITGHMALSLEDSSTQAEWFAKELLFGAKIETPDDYNKKIKAVTAKQVQAIAKKLFVWDMARIAVISPYDKETILPLLNV